MTISSVDVLRMGRERARAGLWKGSTDVALLTPEPTSPLPTAEFLMHCKEELRTRGFSSVITGALSPLEQAGFLAAGFEIAERLHLLEVDLRARPLPDAVDPPSLGWAIRRFRNSDTEEVLRVDGLCFRPFWRFDQAGLADAQAATPTSSFRTVTSNRRTLGPRRVVGYAIFGLAGPRGYVQRLAVDPQQSGQGLGRALIVDGLSWLRRKGATKAVVNTQTDNQAAMSLYLGMGFEPRPLGLSVLRAGL